MSIQAIYLLHSPRPPPLTSHIGWPSNIVPPPRAQEGNQTSMLAFIVVRAALRPMCVAPRLTLTVCLHLPAAAARCAVAGRQGSRARPRTPEDLRGHPRV